MSGHKVRKPPNDEGPWCWQNKQVRRKIREAFDATHNVATALAVYGALTEIASDEASETFTTTHSWIQRISGVSVRTIQNHLSVFTELGLVAVSTPRLRAPSTYTLLTFGNDCATSRNGNASNGNQCATFGNDQFRAPLPTSEESKKKDQKKDQNNVCAEPSAIAVAPARVFKWDSVLRQNPELAEAWNALLAEHGLNNPHRRSDRMEWVRSMKERLAAGDTPADLVRLLAKPGV